MKVFNSILLICLLSGCTGMADLGSSMGGLGVITKDKATFDNATLVEVSPNWLYDPNGSWGNRVKLGAKWTNAAPDYVGLVLSYRSTTLGTSSEESFIGLRGIDVNIDGKVSSYNSDTSTLLTDSGYNTVAKTVFTQSRNVVIVPVEIVKRMVEAEDCRLRIYTSQGYEDSQFSIERMPGGGATAIKSMREFLAELANLNS